jgi:predicted RNase H-like HicB family nuclease
VATADPPTPIPHPHALTVRYVPNPDGWVTAQFVELPAAISQGRDESEAFRNLLDAAHDLTHVPTLAERLATTIQARIIEPLLSLLRR